MNFLTSLAVNLLITGFLVSVGISSAKADKLVMLNGRCLEESHIAEGPIGSDLSGRQSAYFCDTLVVSINLDNGSMMFQFGEKRSTVQLPIAFAGGMDESNMMTVERVYLRPKEASIPNEGFCRLFFKNDATEGSLDDLTGLSCGAQIDKDDRRIVPVIAFSVLR